MVYTQDGFCYNFCSVSWQCIFVHQRVLLCINRFFGYLLSESCKFKEEILFVCSATSTVKFEPAYSELKVLGFCSYFWFFDVYITFVCQFSFGYS